MYERIKRKVLTRHVQRHVEHNLGEEKIQLD